MTGLASAVDLLDIGAGLRGDSPPAGHGRFPQQLQQRDHVRRGAAARHPISQNLLQGTRDDMGMKRGSPGDVSERFRPAVSLGEAD